VPRIAGIDIPKEKRIDVALTYIYGIGKTLSGSILTQANVPPEKRAKELTDEEIARISAVIQESCKVEGDLRRETGMNIKRLMDINCYRGIRHKKGLPVRGQRTHTNARTRKGPRAALIINKPVAKAAPAAPKKEAPK